MGLIGCPEASVTTLEHSRRAKISFLPSGPHCALFQSPLSFQCHASIDSNGHIDFPLFLSVKAVRGRALRAWSVTSCVPFLKMFYPSPDTASRLASVPNAPWIVLNYLMPIFSLNQTFCHCIAETCHLQEFSGTETWPCDGGRRHELRCVERGWM